MASFQLFYSYHLNLITQKRWLYRNGKLFYFYFFWAGVGWSGLFASRYTVQHWPNQVPVNFLSLMVGWTVWEYYLGRIKPVFTFQPIQICVFGASGWSYLLRQTAGWAASFPIAIVVCKDYTACQSPKTTYVPIRLARTSLAVDETDTKSGLSWSLSPGGHWGRPSYLLQWQTDREVECSKSLLPPLCLKQHNTEVPHFHIFNFGQFFFCAFPVNWPGHGRTKPP